MQLQMVQRTLLLNTPEDHRAPPSTNDSLMKWPHVHTLIIFIGIIFYTVDWDEKFHQQIYKNYLSMKFEIQVDYCEHDMKNWQYLRPLQISTLYKIKKDRWLNISRCTIFFGYFFVSKLTTNSEVAHRS